jgi:hypothetical protein
VAVDKHARARMFKMLAAYKMNKLSHIKRDDVTDLLVSGFEQAQVGGLFTRPVHGYPFAQPGTYAGYRFAYSVSPPPSSAFFRYGWDAPKEATPEPEFEVNLAEALIGWKAWSVDKKGLWSVQQAGHRWPPDEAFTATCAERGPSVFDPAGELSGPGCTQPVNESHTCGVYAGSREEAEKYSGQDEENVIGEVYGWGRYVRGDFGWRAEHAYPRCFHLKSGQGNLIEWLRAYHVPIYVEQKSELLIYDPEEDGYHGDRNEEEGGDRGAAEEPAATED